MRLEDFRIYYNHSIYPELMRMERLRKRLLRLIGATGFLLLGLIVLFVQVRLLIVAVAVAIPLVFYIGYLGYRIRKFVLAFKPRIVELIIDFIDDGANMGELRYDAKRHISKERFFASRLFETDAPVYSGEDYITGMVGQTPFALSELTVRDVSPVRTRLDEVFRGVFLHATFPEPTKGQLILWPRSEAQYLTRSIKAFTREGGVNVDHEILNGDFRRTFTAFAMPDTHVIGILSDPMQAAIVEYLSATGKTLYLSFHDRKIYAAMAEPNDLLEPYLFRSNVSFELIREFFSDIILLIKIVEDFDRTH